MTIVLDISSILNTGEVQNIFTVDEKMEIIDRMQLRQRIKRWQEYDNQRIV